MSLTQKMQDAINEQINNELFSSYTYLAMSAYLEHEQFVGSAKWMRMQSQEEYLHAMKLYQFLIDRNGVVQLARIEEPQATYNSVGEVFKAALAQEQVVTSQINALYELAFNEKSFAALVELEWFITEQVEEEKTAREIVHKFNMIGEDPAALLDLDNALGERNTDGSEG